MHKVQLLLRRILTGQHVLDDGLDGQQHDVIVRQRQNVVDLLVEQRMTVRSIEHVNSQGHGKGVYGYDLTLTSPRTRAETLPNPRPGTGTERVTPVRRCCI